MSIDGTDVRRSRFGPLVERLRGEPGDVKRLELLRNGHPVTVSVPVVDAV